MIQLSANPSNYTLMNIGYDLTVQVLSLSSFLYGENTFNLVHEDEKLVTFEAIVSTPGIIPEHARKITILAKEWDKARQKYIESTQEQ
jgi:hypothetical protein